VICGDLVFLHQRSGVQKLIDRLELLQVRDAGNRLL
jgi:hypothetical protein